MSHRRGTSLVLLLGWLAWAGRGEAAEQVRIKDLARVQLGQETLLTGVGLVIGLEGTGDGRRAEFTFQMMANMMQHMNIAVSPEQVRGRNVAGVSVTARLSPFARQGSRLDVQVASLGDASSLQGGTLLQASLMGPDGKVYVTAQGPVSIGGFNAGRGAPGGLTKNHTVAGNVPGGGIVIAEPQRLARTEPEIALSLTEADWTTASRMASAIDSLFGESELATAVDPGTVVVRLSESRQKPEGLVDFIAQLEKVRVVPDLPARVVVNEKTGTVIIGENVSVAAVALSHGNLRLKVPVAAAQEMFGGAVEVEEESDHLRPVTDSFNADAMPTVRELVRNLNALGVTPRDLIAILQALKTAGALRAELIIQ
jgi:flagellar P-ring protein FlgI